MFNHNKSAVTGKVNFPLVFLFLFSSLFFFTTKASAAGCVPSNDNVTGCVYDGASDKMCSGNYNEYLQPLQPCEGGNGYYRSTKYSCNCIYNTQKYKCSPWEWKYVVNSYKNTSLFSNQSCTKGAGSISKEVATNLNSCDAWCRGVSVPTPTPTVVIPVFTPYACSTVYGYVKNPFVGGSAGLAGAMIEVHGINNSGGKCSGGHVGCGFALTNWQGYWKITCQDNIPINCLGVYETKNAANYVDSAKLPSGPAGSSFWSVNQIMLNNPTGSSCGPFTFYDLPRP